MEAVLRAVELLEQVRTRVEFLHAEGKASNSSQGETRESTHFCLATLPLKNNPKLKYMNLKENKWMAGGLHGAKIEKEEGKIRKMLVLMPSERWLRKLCQAISRPVHY